MVIHLIQNLMRSLLIFLTACFLASTAVARNNPIELGKVSWLRDLQTAQSEAAQSKKAILILFQEIPGCSTCKRYGSEVLSHPLIVEAIESLFVPLAIYNNRKGVDEKVLAYYDEPSWNNPVVRIVGPDKKDILPRLDGQYTPSALTNYMIAALKASKQPVPTYLELASKELLAQERGIQKTTFSMYCFWTGEKELGKLDGVVHTEAGFMDGREVVNVYFDPKQIDFKTVIAKGNEARCADRIYADNAQQEIDAKKIAATKHVSAAKTFRPDREPKYYLSKTIYKYVPMSPMQAVKANVLVGEGKNPDDLLSPRQLAMLSFMYEKSSREDAIHHSNWKDLYFKLWDKLQDKS